MGRRTSCRSSTSGGDRTTRHPIGTCPTATVTVTGWASSRAIAWPRSSCTATCPNSNIHIKPKQYAATFFSYIDPAKMKMDDGFTEHSGCPVVEGEKKIVTQWVRLGVDDENPWNSFNTLGIKYSDAENQ